MTERVSGELNGADAGALEEPSGPGSGWYLYGVTHRGKPGEADLALGPGLDGKPVLTFPVRGLVAIVSLVPLDQLGANGLRERLKDTTAVAGWLERMVRGHERLVEEVQRKRGILPAKFGCVYTSADSLTLALWQAHESLLAKLTRLGGCDEWGVKLYADREAIRQRVSAQEPTVLRLTQEVTTATPGRAYLLKRQLTDALFTATEQALVALAQGGYDRLAGHAVAAEMGNLPRTGNAADGEAEILRAAFLVRREMAESFAEGIHRYAEGHEGLRCEYSGPWPPYSFATLDEGEQA